ncbi:MAG TPA: hypothetical protein VKY66_01670 [Protaetiibacter sp.]|nr:hypothetical protein [Protaetiibacter sp.]
MAIDRALTEAPTVSRTRRIGIVAIVLVASAALATGGVVAGAYFTSQATVTGQSVGTATVEIEAGTATTSAALNVPSLLPGDTESTTITLENTGTEAVYYTVTLPTTSAGDAALEDALQVTVVAGTETHTRSLTAWQGGIYQLGTALAAGASIPVTVQITLPLGADDSLQGLDAGFSVTFDAIQARNTTVTAGWIV